MTSNDVMRLYAMLEELRKESRHHLTEVRDEVKGYRADLNGRLRALESAEAHRTGMSAGRGNVGRTIMGVAAVSAACGSVIGAMLAIL